MAKIVWLSSYPKSGNTWLRFMIANLVAGKVSSSSEVVRQVPDVHEGINGQHLFGNHTVVVKTHWKYWSGIPLREDMIGAIYIIRHPIDVLESNLNYAFQRSGSLREVTDAAEIGRAAEKWADDYIHHGGYPRFRQYGIGTWEENVRSWLWSGLSVPRLLVRYEDLLADPVAGLTKVAKFLGSAKSGADIALAVERSSRARMQEIEEREIDKRVEGFFYQARNSSGLVAGHRFVGRSANGEDLFRLTQDQRDAALQRFASIMKEFRYTGASAGKLELSA
ncbi:MAG TPA: sulfotransferase domain-containing protein [Methyloceanibacter sp.]|nr:sulfotransferase domain-containing protein [Methyloceanibacter sp.]